MNFNYGLDVVLDIEDIVNKIDNFFGFMELVFWL